VKKIVAIGLCLMMLMLGLCACSSKNDTGQSEATSQDEIATDSQDADNEVSTTNDPDPTGYGRIVSSDKLNSGADDGIVAAWLCIWDSSEQQPPWLDYFHEDGTWDEVYWENSDGPFENTYENKTWEISDGVLTRYDRYGGSDESFVGRTDQNGYTEVVRHTDNSDMRYIAISDEAYKVLKDYSYSDWSNFDYTTLTAK